MKNIEKYHETKAALEAYNSLGLKMFPFEEWIEREYEDPSKQTLLESAERLTDAWFNGCTIDVVKKKILVLADAIEREKKKPVRNCDKYRTKDEALMAFKKMCCGTGCRRCRFRDCGTEDACRLAWLYDESEKDEAK